jgi:ribosomal protein S24E
LRFNSDILHPNRANISKEELREKLGSLYKAQKDQISVFGLRTQFGGGKTTGFALVYDSPEAMKKFEPQYRLVRVGLATKAERASRQQRALQTSFSTVEGVSQADRQLQASSARTDKRPSVVRQRSRVPRPRRRNKRLDDLAWACVYPRAGWGAAMAACMRWCVHLRSILVGVGIGIGYRDLLGGTARGYSGLDEEDCFHRRLFSITLA